MASYRVLTSSIPSPSISPVTTTPNCAHHCCEFAIIHDFLLALDGKGFLAPRLVILNYDVIRLKHLNHIQLELQIQCTAEQSQIFLVWIVSETEDLSNRRNAGCLELGKLYHLQLPLQAVSLNVMIIRLLASFN